MGDFIESLNIDCPYCNKEIQVKVSSIGKPVKCPHCNKTFQTEDAGVVDGLKGVNKSMDDLLSNFDNFEIKL